MRRKGIGLGTTLVVAFLVLTLGFAVASLSVTHLNLQARSSNAEQALDLARSAVNLGLARVLTNRAYAGTVDYTNESGSGRLTFEDVKDLPKSTNNLAGLGSVSSPDGQVVPAQALLLVGVGDCRGVARQVEALYYLPPFPYAAASDGPIQAFGGVEVMGVGDPPAPASMLSNAPVDQALLLGPGSRVSGGLKAVGGIVVDPSSVVSGQVAPRREPEEIGQLFLRDYDPLNLGRTPTVLDPAYTDASFGGILRRQGDLAVAGDLELDSALLFVDGDLTVSGNLKGKGVLAVTGNVTVQQSATLAADDKLALMAGGRLELRGTGPASSSFQGVVYAENGVEARQLTVRGVVVAHKPTPIAAGQSVELDQCHLIRDPDLTRVSLTLTDGPAKTDRFFVSKYKFRDDYILDVVPPGEYFAIEVRRERSDFFRATITNRARLGVGLVRPGTARDVADQLHGFITPTEDLGLRDAIQRRLLDLGSGGGGTPGVTEIVVDPSRFLPDAERIRVLSWRELSVAR